MLADSPEWKKFAFVVTTMCLPSGAQSCLIARSSVNGNSWERLLPSRPEAKSPWAGSKFGGGPKRFPSKPTKLSVSPSVETLRRS